MLKTHEQFNSTIGKRQILVIDDEQINREMMGALLSNEFEVLYAQNGEEGLEKIRQMKETLSLVLLDLIMPVMPGIQVLKIMREEELLSSIPVIVLTSDQSAEVECLNLGASDFLPKPYPDADVVYARIWRTIELSEDRKIIQTTERDELTGLYNREYFYSYARQYDQHHRDVPTDVVVVDVNHFHLINERYGKQYGDEVLRRISERLRELVHDSGGIVCRREADTFMIYSPHREDYEAILAEASRKLTGEDEPDNRVRLRMGIYLDSDKSIDIERRFDRAKIAADTVKGSFTKTIAYYDDAMHDREIYAEQLIEDFYGAIGNEQFLIYYQPKYDIRGEEPVMTSMEALVRWDHPDLGLVSPGVFIPLFEENGLIRELDHYVWRKTCGQIREWKEKPGNHLPVSVNVSRIDLYDPELVPFLQKLIREYELTYNDLLLEITESAYTQDTEQIAEVANRLRNIGFRIEMDDFGTGYSSLNMVSSLPFDVMKLDMQFIRSAFREGGDTRMLELIIDIAEYLSVPVVAEGVETEEQLRALKDMGCDIVQGFYFSRPVPADEITQKLCALKADGELKKNTSEAEKTPARAKQPEALPYITDDAVSVIDEQEKPVAEKAEAGRSGLHLRTAIIFFAVIAFLAAAALFAADIAVTNGYNRMERASDRYIEAQLAASDMESGSDYLTDRVRCFVVTGEVDYLNDFVEEVQITRRRDLAVEKLEMLLENSEDNALSDLNNALLLSNELILIENHAMRLKLESGDYDMSQVPEDILAVELTAEELALSDAQMNTRAEELVFDNNYMHYKDRIRENVSLCTQSLIRSSSQELEKSSARMQLLVTIQTVMTVLFLLIVLTLVAFINELIRKPLTRMVEGMQQHRAVTPTGAEELRFVTRTYNTVLEENNAAHEQLKHEASHDALTGLLNRGAYDLLIQSVDRSHIALIIVDVDYFKQVNDTYGHAMGDRILKQVASLLKESFRSVDVICRIGGDEFVVIMTRVDSSMRDLVKEKIRNINETLQHPQDDLPAVSLSVGVAFADRENPRGDIFKDADTALYRVKEAGRNGCEIY